MVRLTRQVVEVERLRRGEEAKSIREAEAEELAEEEEEEVEEEAEEVDS
jgi:hypothetical protein